MKQTKCKEKSPLDILIPYAVTDGYCAQRIDMRTSRSEAIALRRVFDGLRKDGATLVNGQFINTVPDVFRWWLQRVYQELYGDTPANEISPATFQ